MSEQSYADVVAMLRSGVEAEPGLLLDPLVDKIRAYVTEQLADRSGPVIACMAMAYLLESDQRNYPVNHAGNPCITRVGLPARIDFVRDIAE